MGPQQRPEDLGKSVLLALSCQTSRKSEGLLEYHDAVVPKNHKVLRPMIYIALVHVAADSAEDSAFRTLRDRIRTLLGYPRSDDVAA